MKRRQVTSRFVVWAHKPTLSIQPSEAEWVVIYFFNDGSCEISDEKPSEDEVSERFTDYITHAHIVGA